MNDRMIRKNRRRRGRYLQDLYTQGDKRYTSPEPVWSTKFLILRRKMKMEKLET
jgi:hypothetical protein